MCIDCCESSEVLMKMWNTKLGSWLYDCTMNSTHTYRVGGLAFLWCQIWKWLLIFNKALDSLLIFHLHPGKVAIWAESDWSSYEEWGNSDAIVTLWKLIMVQRKWNGALLSIIQASVIFQHCCKHSSIS